MEIREAEIADLSHIYDLELESFSAEIASDKRSLKRSISSRHQKVYVLEEEGIVGCAVVYVHKKSIRLYSIAVAKSAQNRGYGRALLLHCEDYAIRENKENMTLEADAENIHLINWYSSNGYQISDYVEDYYGQGLPAYVMTKRLGAQKPNRSKVKSIVVTENDMDFPDLKNVEIVKAKDYISQEQFQVKGQYRVFNFCSSYEYQSFGYYISLLAEARGQRVLPSVATIQDTVSTSLVKIFAEELKSDCYDDFYKQGGNKVSYKVILGCESTGKTSRLSKSLYKLFDAPFVEYTFVRSENWLLDEVRLMTLPEVIGNKDIPFAKIASYALSKKSLGRRLLTNYQFNLAILVNPEEANPPSDKVALEKFRAAGIANGFYVEFITKRDMDRLNEFDALFIRETTAVNDHTYQIARHAQAEGLIVVDDPWSILKCSNKLYLYESMKQAKINMPKTRIMSTNEIESRELDDIINYPVIIKQPDSAFSLGVFKANSENDLREKCVEILEKSEFVLVQEYIESDFDWRIGIMNKEVLFACKYFMAKGHWQIYNWSSDGEEGVGLSETLHLENVPQSVLDTALKAANVIGDGLYGVDIKVVNDKCYLIEVNDNPNIDSGIEDAVLQDVLYDRIIRHIRARVIDLQSHNKKICM